MIQLLIEVGTLLVLFLLSTIPANAQFKVTTDLRNRTALNGTHVITDGNNTFMDGYSGTYVYNDTLTVDDGYYFLRCTALPMGGWVKLKTNQNSTSDLKDTMNTRLMISALTSGLIAAVLGFTPANAATVPNTAGSGISISGSTITNTAPDQVVSLTGANSLTTTGTYPNFTITQYVPTSNVATRPVNSTTYTISTTKQSFVNYNITISCTATIGSAATGSVALQYSTNAGSTWNTIGTISNSNTISLAVTLNSVQISGLQLSGFIPANALVRMVSTTTGTTSISYLNGMETY